MSTEDSAIEPAAFGQVETALRSLTCRVCAMVEKQGSSEIGMKVWRLLLDCWQATNRRCFFSVLQRAAGAAGQFVVGECPTAFAAKPDPSDIALMRSWLPCASTFVDLTSTVLYKHVSEGARNIHVVAEVLGHVGAAIVQLNDFGSVPEGGGSDVDGAVYGGGVGLAVMCGGDRSGWAAGFGTW